MKGMISTIRRSRKKPLWIGDTLWRLLCADWNTEGGRKRSKTASKAQKSPRNGLGVYKHVSGQKSFIQVEDEMEVEKGRPVTYGEVFIKTHTRRDGTYIDEKAKKVSEIYEDNRQARLSQVEMELSETLDGTSSPPKLSLDEDNTIFLQSTFVDVRGHHFGLGSLEDTHSNGKQNEWPGSTTSAYVAIEEQLKSAQRQIEEQATAIALRDAEQARRDAESARILAEQQTKIDYLGGDRKLLA